MVLALRDRIERVEQGEEPVRAGARDSERSTGRPSTCRWALRPWAASPPRRACRTPWRSPAWRNRPDTSAKVAKLAMVGVWPLLSGSWMSPPHPPVCEIDEIRHIAGGDAQAERVALDRGAIDELRMGPDRGDGRHFVDRHMGRRLVAQHGQKRQRRIVAAGLVGGRNGRPWRRDKARASAPGAATESKAKCPSASVRACAICCGAPEPAAQSVTVELATGCPPPRTCPSSESAAAGAAASPIMPADNRREASFLCGRRA